MQFLSLLNQPLKSDEMIDLLEDFDMEVIYEFDRIQEGSPDQYTAGCEETGLELHFDENQILTTIFIHLQNGDDCTAASLGDSDIQAFRSPIETRQFAEKNLIPFKQSRSDLSVSGLHWIRIDYPNHAIHYQFQEGMLTLVSIMTNAVKP